MSYVARPAAPSSSLCAEGHNGRVVGRLTVMPLSEWWRWWKNVACRAVAL
jgi:hypothetical protein